MLKHMPLNTITVIAADTWWQLTPQRRGQLRDWMKENELPAHDIAAGEAVFIEGSTVTYTQILRDKDGKVRTALNNDGEISILAEERTIPLISFPPGSTFSAN